MAPEPKDLPVFSDFERNDTSMKVWLPQILSERLDWISKREDVSRPDAIRALMFEHLYGRVAYMALLAFDAQRQSEDPLAQARIAAADKAGLERMMASVAHNLEDTRFSRERNSRIDAELIGKPTDNLRLELPLRLKADLAAIARAHCLTPSSYVRKLLVQQLLGERVHTNWQAAIGNINRDIERLEQDR